MPLLSACCVGLRVLLTVGLPTQGSCRTMPGERLLLVCTPTPGKPGVTPLSIGMDCRIGAAGKGQEEWANEAKSWEEMGATHLSVETRRGGLKSPQEHIETIRRFKEAVH